MNLKKMMYMLIIIIICVFTFSIVSMNKNLKENTITTSSGSVLSNKKIGWGIKRNDTVNHKSMPDLDDNKIKEEVMTLHTAVYEKFRLWNEIHKATNGRVQWKNIRYN